MQDTIFTNISRTAFTLAEVLITLGVIGVVAAMTMPSLIANYQKKVWVNQLKKSVSVLEQGFQKMLADDGVDNLSDTYVWSYAKLKGSSNCYTFDYGSNSLCTQFYNELKKYFNIVDISETPEYNWDSLNNKGKGNCSNIGSEGMLKFADGMWLFMQTTNSSSTNAGYIYIDINGAKRPNMCGRDVFYFGLSENGKIIADGNAEMCDTGDIGDNCGARIIKDGWEMNY